MKVARNLSKADLFKADLFKADQTATTRKGRMKPLRHEVPTRAVHADPMGWMPRFGSVGVRARAGGRPAFQNESLGGGE